MTILIGREYNSHDDALLRADVKFEMMVSLIKSGSLNGTKEIRDENYISEKSRMASEELVRTMSAVVYATCYLASCRRHHLMSHPPQALIPALKPVVRKSNYSSTPSFIYICPISYMLLGDS